MIHLAPLPRALIGIGGRVGGAWGIVLGLGIAVGPLVLGMRTIAIHSEQRQNGRTGVLLGGGSKIGFALGC